MPSTLSLQLGWWSSEVRLGINKKLQLFFCPYYHVTLIGVKSPEQSNPCFTPNSLGPPVHQSHTSRRLVLADFTGQGCSWTACKCATLGHPEQAAPIAPTDPAQGESCRCNSCKTPHEIQGGPVHCCRKKCAASTTDHAFTSPHPPRRRPPQSRDLVHCLLLPLLCRREAGAFGLGLGRFVLFTPWDISSQAPFFFTRSLHTVTLQRLIVLQLRNTQR